MRHRSDVPQISTTLIRGRLQNQQYAARGGEQNFSSNVFEYYHQHVYPMANSMNQNFEREMRKQSVCIVECRSCAIEMTMEITYEAPKSRPTTYTQKRGATYRDGNHVKFEKRSLVYSGTLKSEVMVK